MFKVIFENAGGELDHREVEEEGEVIARYAIEMIRAAGEMYAGDKITVVDLDQ